MEQDAKTIDSIKLVLTNTSPTKDNLNVGRESFGSLTVEDTETPYPREIYTLKEIAFKIGTQMFKERGSYREGDNDPSITVEHIANANDLFFDSPTKSLIKSMLACKCRYHSKGLLVTTSIVTEYNYPESLTALVVDIKTIESSKKLTDSSGMVVKQYNQIELLKKFKEIDSLKDIDFTFNPHTHRYDGEGPLILAVMDILLKLEEEYKLGK